MAVTIDDINRGDTIKIVLLDDTFLNMYYRNVEGIVESINYSQEYIKGTWGPIEIYPSCDNIEILNHVELNTIK